jgi:hypothetical protein
MVGTPYKHVMFSGEAPVSLRRRCGMCGMAVVFLECLLRQFGRSDQRLAHRHPRRRGNLSSAIEHAADPTDPIEAFSLVRRLMTLYPPASGHL